jgi:hypothetical protein
MKHEDPLLLSGVTAGQDRDHVAHGHGLGHPSSLRWKLVAVDLYLKARAQAFKFGEEPLGRCFNAESVFVGRHHMAGLEGLHLLEDLLHVLFRNAVDKGRDVRVRGCGHGPITGQPQQDHRGHGQDRYFFHHVEPPLLKSQVPIISKKMNFSSSKRAGRCEFRVLPDQFGTLLKMILEAKVD